VLARLRFEVDETRVGMGVLIHPAFQNEIANGVVRLTLAKGDALERLDYEIVTLPGDGTQVTHADNEQTVEIVTGHGNGERIRVIQPLKGFSQERTLFTSRVYLGLGQMMTKLVADYRVGDQEVDIESEFKMMPGSDVDPQVFIKQVRRVPHPSSGHTVDGSPFLALGGAVTIDESSENNTSAIADLWMPKRIEFTIDSFTARDVEAGSVRVRSLKFSLNGLPFTADNIVAKLRLPRIFPGFAARPGYTVEIPLQNPLFPSLRLEAEYSTEDSSLVTHSLNHPTVRWTARLPQKDVPFLWDPNSQEVLFKSFDPNPVGVARALPAANGRLVITAKKGNKTIQLTSSNTVFVGEGDGRSIRMGATVITGILANPIEIPGSAVGYGANHHEGLETFVFDLLAAPNLSAADRSKIESKFGRYLHAQPGGDEGEAQMVGLKADGAQVALGKWKSAETRVVSP
jgi:hypothetical protein